MSDNKGAQESLLSLAKDQERLYGWGEAATLYRSAVSSLSEVDAAGAGRVFEMLSHALFKFAFQADTANEFKNRLEDSVVATERALNLYRGTTQSSSPALAKRCEGVIAFTNFWLAPDQQEKKRLIADAWNRCNEALRGFEKIKDHEEHGLTLEYLALSAALAFSYEDDPKNRERILRNAASHGEKAVQYSDTLEDPRIAAAVLAICAAFVRTLGLLFTPVHSREPVAKRAKDYWEKALTVSRQQATLELPYFDILWDLPFSDTDELDRTLQKALVEGRKTRDKLLIGSVLEMQVSNLEWKAIGVEDEETREDLLNRSLQLAREAKEAFSAISYLAPTVKLECWTEVPEAAYYALLVFTGTDLDKKREYAEKGLPYAREEVRRAVASGLTDVAWQCKDTLNHILIGLAETKTDPEEKARLLEESIEVGTEVLRSGEKYIPLRPDINGYWHGPLGHAKLELATLAKDRALKEELLKDGIRHEETAIELGTSHRGPWAESDPGSVEIDAYFRHKLVGGLRDLFELTGQTQYLEKAIEALETTVKKYHKVSMCSRMAECHWKIALYQDILGRFQAAAKNFRSAADDFKSAAEKLPNLKALYDDHSKYMSAWENIEEAKYQHSRQKYAQAKESYERAASLHESTERWPFLAANYSALARVEDAEDLSQKEQSKESIAAFEEASTLFGSSETLMRERLAVIDSLDEKHMVEMLIEAIDFRQSLCSARITLEEARTLDREGVLGDAAEKYGLAADMFASVKRRPPHEQDRREMELITILSRAWKAMAKAEAESSPELYEEAANLFDEAKNFSQADKAKNLVMGHSHLCMALAAGARFADTDDPAFHSSAVRHLESAAKYYLKANLEGASEYAKASKLLFDSYAFMNRASGEDDQQMKTKLYSMAEKVLQASAASFEKARQPGRKEQVVRLLTRVKEDRELAVSLVEVFRAPDIVSTTMAFSSPATSHEKAVGLDRFEHADVQATVIARPKDPNVGEEFSLDIELVNAGRGHAQLTKVEEVVPRGFIIKTEPTGYRVEGSHLNLRGKRLDPLRTEDIRLILTPKERGRFKICPRVMYLDEVGKYRLVEPDPVDVTVKELGISGWLRGADSGR